MLRIDPYRIVRVTIIVALASVFLLPFVILIIQSLAPYWPWPDCLPSALDLRSWHAFFQEPQILSALLWSIVIGGAVVFLNLLLALPAGKALAHYSFTGKAAVEFLLMLPILVPLLGVAMGIQIAMLRLGLANTWSGVVVIQLLPTIPYSIRMAYAGFAGWGIKWEEQARSLGIGAWRIFWDIWVPMLLPVIRGIVFLSFVISLSQYILTVLIGGGEITTLAVVYFPYLAGSNSAIIAGFSLVFALMPLLFTGMVEGLIRLLLPMPLWFWGGQDR